MKERCVVLVKVTRGNQVTIPKEIVKRAHIHEGNDYVDMEYAHGTIVLKLVDVEERIPAEAYDKLLRRVAAKEAGDKILSKTEARDFLKRRAKA